MRPARLELEGFMAFRDRTVVDFEGVELFALCGPTGAGKTSVIDAITFALYGSVPRLGEKLVAPVLAQGKVEARLRLDFSVAEVPYTVVRVVRATKGGATTKQARLERAGEALATDAAEVSERVVDLLGLDFRQFTTCVSLPQGEFARFLHEEPRKRGDLLVRLLDLGLYDRVAALARQRAALAHERAAACQSRLDELAGATPEAVEAAAARVRDLTALRDRIDEAQPELDTLRASIEAAERDAAACAESLALLATVVIPDGVADLASALGDATAAYEAARQADTDTAEALDKAEAALAALPPRSEVEELVARHDQHAALAELVADSQAAATGAAALEARAAEALVAAEADRAGAAAELERARTAELAHTLAATLVVGEPCPVCEQPVTALHRRAAPKVEAAQRALARAERAVAEARTAATKAATARARADEKLAGAQSQLAAVAARLEHAPGPDALQHQLAEIGEAAAAVDAAKQAATAARARRADAERAVEAARGAEQAARATFDRCRDAVAALGPPAPARIDLAADWQELHAWAQQRRPELEETAAAHRAAADRDRAALAELRDAVAAACSAVGVEPGERPRDAVVDALSGAEVAHRRVQDQLAEAQARRVELATATAEESVAHLLANHLKADRFEQWLLDAVLQQLVEGATDLLLELSGGAYSLVLDAKSRAFAVVDHVNAGAVRAARTLSGGETFLASLALALALADEVAMVAASAARLETILLDEGFGTLDGDTLEVVATALEELGARGRMVGIVTHVRELAQRLPVRFEVRKVSGAATVERVDG